MLKLKTARKRKAKRTHRCPAQGCRQRVPNNRAFCRQHWRALHGTQRALVMSSFHYNGSGTAEHIDVVSHAARTLGRTGVKPR